MSAARLDPASETTLTTAQPVPIAKPGGRLITRCSGPVMTVEFNHPPRHFFDERMSIELDQLTRQLQKDSSVRAVVFTGTETSYLTHIDIPSMLAGASAIPMQIGYRPARAIANVARLAVISPRADALLRRTAVRDTLLLARAGAALDRLSRLDQVVITAINGLALGMGAIFALACDIRIMADDTEIGWVESGLSIMPAAGGTQRLTHIAGAGTAIELMLEGRRIGATEAQRLGLVQHVRPRGELHSATMEIADRLAGRSANATREIKRSVYHSGTRPLAGALRREAASFIHTVSTATALRTISEYGNYLDGHHPLTDETILQAWGPLLGQNATDAPSTAEVTDTATPLGD